MSFRIAVTEICPHNLRSQFGSRSKPQLRFTMSGKQRNPAKRQESSGKRPRNLQLPGRSHLHYGSARVELAKTNRRVCKWSLRRVPRCHRQHRSRAYIEPALCVVQNRSSESRTAGLHCYTQICIPREQGSSGGGATADSSDDGSCRRLLLKRSSIQLPSSQTPSWHSSFCSIGLRFR